MTFAYTEPVLVGLAVALILLERSRHTFKSRRELFDVLNPAGKEITPYLVETLPIFIYTVSVLFCLALYFYSYPNLLSSNMIRLASILLFVCGAAIRRWAIRVLGPSWSVYVAPVPEQASLVTSVGPYKYFRHPYYLGSIIEFFGLLTFLVGLGIAAAITLIQLAAYAVRARAEERHLISRFDAEYTAYKNRVGGFLPKSVKNQRDIGNHAMPRK